MKALARLWVIFRSFTGEIVLSLLLGVAAIAASIGLLGTSAFIIASAALHPSIATLQVAIVGVRFFGISRGVFRYLERLVSHSVNLRVVSRLREDFIRRVEPGAPANLVTRQGGDLLQSVMGDVQALENFYVRVISPVVVALVIVTGVSLFIGQYAVELGVILLMGMLLTGFMQPMLALLVTRGTTNRLTRTNAEISAKLVEYLQGLEDLQAANAQQRFISNLERNFEQAGRQQNRIVWLNGLNSGVSLMLTNLSLLLILWAAIPLVSIGAFSGVTLAVISLVVLASFEAISPLNAAAQNFNTSRAAAQRLFSIGGADVSEESQSLDSPAQPCECIRFDHVSFTFSHDAAQIVEDITFELSPRKKLAIVGASGAGKTSLLNLLLAFYQPTGGGIKIDGDDARTLNSDGVRSLFSVLPQNPYIFNEDVRGNLLLAAPEAADETLLETISLAGLADWLASLPDGLDTWIGERGVKMSGGERQRLALARLYLQDRSFLLLDEPTAGLDQATAREVMETIFNWGAQKGMLIISHDLRWMPQMDEILLIEKGHVVEQGRMPELLALHGRFASMYELEKNNLVE